MGSYDNIVKIEAMRRRVEENDMASALKILETITIKKIKNMSDLSLIAEVYAGNQRYEEALQLFHKIYEKTRTRKALYQLVDLSIKSNNLEDAQYYLVEYQKIAPKDFYKYVFRYKIDKLMGAPYEKLIDTLEALKATEYIEKWAYELAKTYYKAGMDQECIKECSDIILWFGEGPYVEKAKILRSYFSGETNKEKIMEELKRRASGKVESIESEDATYEEAIYEEAASEDAISENTMSDDTAEDYDAIYENLKAALYSYEYTDEIAKQQAATYIEEDTENQEANPYEVDGTYAYDGTYEEAAPNLEVDHYEEANPDQEAVPYQEEDPYQEAEFYQEANPYAEDFEVSEREEAEDTAEIDIRWNAIAAGFELDLNAIFGDFLSELGIKGQIVKSLEYILEEEGEPVRMLFTGEAGTGKTTLAKAFTLFLYETGMLGSSRIAKIDAQKLNTIDLSSKKDTLRDCCLVIEHAAKLQAATIESLLELCDSLWGNIAVILEEAPDKAQSIFLQHPRLEKLFGNQIHL